MGKLLHINASPRTSSYSLRVAKAFLKEFRQKHPEHGIEELNLFSADLPEFKAPEAAAKYAVLGGQKPSGKDAEAWKVVIDVIDRFKSADLYVINSPMWNFSIPYRLKQYVDILVQPSLTFNYSPEEGYTGLVTGKPALLILARGGSYGPGGAGETNDYQRTYLENILGFIGFTDIRNITIQPTLMEGPAVAEKAALAAIDEACELVPQWP